MKEKILQIIKEVLKAKGLDAVLGGDGAMAGVALELTVPEDPNFGHYSTNFAMRAAKAQGKKPMVLGQELAAAISVGAPAGFFEKVEAAAPGFINFWLHPKTVQEAFAEVVSDENFGKNNELGGKMVMVEFTDANPFKLFHIGHLMSNTIGESFARLHEAAGATVRRANYYGDVGLHIAMSVWGMTHLADAVPQDDDAPAKKMEFLGRAYAAGSTAHKDGGDAAAAIVEINKKIYDRSDATINQLYDKGLAWSLAYFETIYGRLGTKFDDYFPESTVGALGVEVVRAHPDIFIESEGAIIFPGEKYGLHTRVFINSQGLPVYEAKELGLNKKKFDLYPLDLSIVVTGNEIKDYFNVLLMAMGLTLPEVAKKTRHAPHGMLRLPTGKMSSRTGDVVTAAALIDRVKDSLRERMSDKVNLTDAEREDVAEAVAIGALKYSILRQSPGQDIIFDFDTSLSFEGDSGPYIQYAYARLRNILRKAEESGIGGSSIENNKQAADALAEATHLDSEVELALMGKILEFPDIVAYAREKFLPSSIVTYLYKLTSLANKFYETTPILKDDVALEQRTARLLLVKVAARTIRDGLALLGIKVPEKI